MNIKNKWFLAGCIGTIILILMGQPFQVAYTAQLKVTTSTWSEFSVTDEEEQILTVHVGYDFEYSGIEDLVISVTKISEDGVRIRTNTAMSQKGSVVGINMSSTQRHFAIPKGKEIELNTLTYDAGDNYTIEVLSVDKSGMKLLNTSSILGIIALWIIVFAGMKKD